MSKGRTHWLRFTIIVLIICAIGSGALAMALFNRNAEQSFASASLQLTFEGAAQGFVPNGIRYDMNSITSDEVLDAALQAAGLSDRYTAEQVRVHMDVRGVYPRDVVNQLLKYESLLDFHADRSLNIRVYYPTQYIVILYSDLDDSLPGSQLQGLLTEIMTAFTEYFCRVYALGANPIELEFDLDDFDYPQILEIVYDSLTRTAAYAQSLFGKEPTLKYNVMDFNDIYVRCRNVIDSDVSRLNSFIVMNGLAKNPDRMVIKYQYFIRELKNRLTMQKDRLSKVDALIATYEKNKVFYFATSEQMSKIDDNSSDTYDEMVNSRKTLADSITTIQNNIDVGEMRINDLVEEVAAGSVEGDAAEGDGGVVNQVQTTTPRADESQLASLEEQIQTVLTKRESIMRDFAALITAYNEQVLNAQTVTASKVRYNTLSLKSGSFIKLYIKTAGPICVLGFMFCLVLIIISRLGEGRKKKHRKPVASSR